MAAVSEAARRRALATRLAALVAVSGLAFAPGARADAPDAPADTVAIEPEPETETEPESGHAYE